MSADKYSEESRGYNLGSAEIDRYNRHGIAHVRVDTSISVDAGCYVNLTGLKPQPLNVWLRRHPSGLDLIIASPTAHGIPEDALEIDSGRRLEGLEVGAVGQQVPNKDLLRVRYDGEKV